MAAGAAALLAWSTVTVTGSFIFCVSALPPWLTQRTTTTVAMPLEVMLVVMTLATVIGAADDFGLEDSSECEVKSTECCCDR